MKLQFTAAAQASANALAQEKANAIDAIAWSRNVLEGFQLT